MNRRQRDKNRRNAEFLKLSFGVRHKCIACGEALPPGQGHFVPPSFGEPGFYWCEMVRVYEDAQADPKGQ